MVPLETTQSTVLVLFPLLHNGHSVHSPVSHINVSQGCSNHTRAFFSPSLFPGGFFFIGESSSSICRNYKSSKHSITRDYILHPYMCIALLVVFWLLSSIWTIPNKHIPHIVDISAHYDSCLCSSPAFFCAWRPVSDSPFIHLELCWHREECKPDNPYAKHSTRDRSLEVSRHAPEILQKYTGMSSLWIGLRKNLQQKTLDTLYLTVESVLLSPSILGSRLWIIGNGRLSKWTMAWLPEIAPFLCFAVSPWSTLLNTLCFKSTECNWWQELFAKRRVLCRQPNAGYQWIANCCLGTAAEDLFRVLVNMCLFDCHVGQSIIKRHFPHLWNLQGELWIISNLFEGRKTLSLFIARGKPCPRWCGSLLNSDDETYIFE